MVISSFGIIYLCLNQDFEKGENCVPLNIIADCLNKKNIWEIYINLDFHQQGKLAFISMLSLQMGKNCLQRKILQDNFLLREICYWIIIYLEKSILGDYCTWKTLSLINFLAGEIQPRSVLYLEKFVIGEIVVWRKLSMEKRLLGGYCIRRYFYLDNSVPGENSDICARDNCLWRKQ